MARPFWPTWTTGPDLIVDPHSENVTDPDGFFNLGYPDPHGIDRLVQALPTDPEGPNVLEPVQLVVDQESLAIGDPEGNAIGQPAIVVHRLLTAGRV